MKRYMIRRKKTGLFSYGHGDWECEAKEGKLYNSLGSAKSGLSYALRIGKQRSEYAIRIDKPWGGFTVRDARRFLDLYEKKEIKKDYEIVEFDFVESKVHNAG